MNERKQFLDILRVIAIILVVLTHCVPQPPISVKTSVLQAFISVICAPSSELFLVISGALLLPVIRPTKEFLKKRFLRVFPPLIFWSIVIVIFRQHLSYGETLKALVSIPIKPVIEVYWFFYVISGLYIFAPIISKWLLHSSKKEIRFFILLWGVTLTLGSISILFNIQLINIEGSYYFILNSFGGFLGYMVLGSYLRNHTARRSVKKNIIFPLCILFSIFLLGFVGNKFNIIKVDIFIHNLSIVTALMVYSFFMLIKDLQIKNKTIAKIISEIALCSYGIYLIHIIISHDFVWKIIEYFGISGYNSMIKITVSLVLSFSISYLVVRLIKFLPFSKYIVG